MSHHPIRGRLLLAALLAGGLPLAASAQSEAPVTTRALGELCAAPEGPGAAFCRGFLIAAGQYHAAVTAAPAGRPQVFCLAGGAAPTVEQAQTAFANWVRANPQHAEERAVDGLMRWAAETYPCAPRPARR